MFCLGRARAARPHVSCSCADARRLPYKDATFDGVICFQVIEHVNDIPCVLREMMRVARPGGRIIILSPNLLSPFNVIMPFLERGKNTHLFGKRKKKDALRLLFSHTRLLAGKLFSSRAHFSYRTPVLENRVDFIADNDAVYLSCPVDFKRFFKSQHGARLLCYQACGRIGRFLPDFSTGVYIVAEVNASGGKI
jgi:SAM-dependent methyltransferase